MASVWKRVLTEEDLAPNTGTVGASVANSQEGLVTGNSVFDYIAAQNFGSGAGDIQSVNQGNGIETSATAGGTAGNIASGDSFIRVKPAASGGITVDASGVALASTVAGNGLTITNGVINVAGQSGVTVTANAIAVNPDDVTIEVASATGDVQVKDGGISFAKLSDAAVHISTDNSGNFPSTDTELASARAIGLSFPNVSLLGVANGSSTTNYLQLNASGSGIQEVTMGVIDISDDTDFDVNNTSNNQQDVDLTFANSTLTATTPGLATSSNVTFANVNATGNLSVGGDATITGNLTVQGDTVTMNTSTILVEDKLITLGNVSNATTTTANNAGIQVNASSTATEWPELRWLKDGPLTGWHVENYKNARTGDSLHPIAVMEVKDNATPIQTDESGGIGSFWFDKTSDNLYICTNIS